MTSKGAGLLAIVIAAAVLWAIPTASVGKVSLKEAGDALKQAAEGAGATVQGTVSQTEEELRKARERAKAALAKSQGASSQRVTATDPATHPPAHGSNPHGQGGVAVVDTNPSSERPLASDPTGAASGESDGAIRTATPAAASFSIAAVMSAGPKGAEVTPVLAAGGALEQLTTTATVMRAVINDLMVPMATCHSATIELPPSG